MAIISRLAVLLGLDAGEFNAGLGAAKSKVQGFSAGSIISLATVGTAFVALTKSAVAYADQISDTAKANDVSVQSILRLSQALQVNGGQADSSSKLMATFNNKIDEAAQGSDKAQKSFQRIGISIKDLKTLSPEQLFEKTVKSLGGIEESSKRNALAMEMFGKAIKGVDIRGLAQQMDENKGSFADTEIAFNKINTALDKLKIAWQATQVKSAQTNADWISSIADWAEENITNMDKVIAKNQQLVKQYGALIAMANAFGIRHDEPVVGQIGSVQNAGKIPGALSGIGGIADPNRQVREVAIADALKKQNEALSQQVATYNLETKSVGQVASAYNKLQIEYEKGGKYDQVNAKARAEANAAALKLDIANKDQFLKQQTQEARNAQELLKIQISLAGASDTQQQKALELKKVDQDILAIKLKYPYATDAEIEALKRLKQETVGLEEQAKRTQNTFQNGFSHAFENFKEKALDSFAQGEQAFSSMADSMSSALDQFVATGKISFKSLIADMIKNLIKLQMQAQLSGFFKFLGSALGFASGSSAGLTATAPSAGGLAMSWSAGGNELSGGQPSMVGENGPEMFIPKSAGTIVPNNRMNSLMGNQPQVVYNGPYIANMSAIDTQSATQFLAKNKQAVWGANQSAQRSLPQSR